MNNPNNIKVFATYPHPCSYLEGREAVTLFIDPEAPMDQALYSRLSDNGFRRSGPHVYRPHCRGCSACIAARIPVARFKPNRTQRKLLRRNQDLRMTLLRTLDDNVVYRLYERYISLRHADGDMYPPSRDQYNAFLTDAWGTTRYCGFYAGTELVAVAVIDVLQQGLSAVYTFYDPERTEPSLGTWVILQQIEMTLAVGLDYLYLGYWIADSPKMAYKGTFRPLEILDQGGWHSLD